VESTWKGVKPFLAFLRLELARKANSNSRTKVTVGLEKRLFTHPLKLHFTQARFSSYIA